MSLDFLSEPSSKKSKIRPADLNFLEEILEMKSGYLLNFSDRTLEYFFATELDINISDKKYIKFGTSKANRLRALLHIEDAVIIAKTLRALWEYKDSYKPVFEGETDGEVFNERERYFEIIRRIEGDETVLETDSIDKFSSDETLAELVDAIKREIEANKPQVAMDRLHTYCMKYFGHLLTIQGINYDKDEPLNSRVGKYVRVIEKEGSLTEVSIRIMKSAIGVFESFNSVRNNKSLAHDNLLIEKQEARFIFDSITAILRFVRAIESNKSNRADKF